jgi:hypothetical protein
MMRITRRLRTPVLAAALGALVLLAFAPAASAQDEGGQPKADDEIVLTGRLVVPEGDAVGTAVIFNGDATVLGTVTESLVVFNGDVVVSGSVGNDIVAFNGRVLIRSGAEVGGDIASRRTAVVERGATVGGQIKGISGRFDFEGWGWISRYVWWFGYTISTLILGLALLGFAPSADRALAEAFRRRTGGSFGFGALIFFVLPIVAVLLLLIVVAIPLGLFLLLGLALLYTIGYVAGAQVVGRQVVKEPRGRFAAFFAGWGILRAIALIPFLGGLAFMLTSIVGLGALLIASRAASGAGADLAPAGVPPAPPPVPAPPL